jgi:hypothetical protein
MERMARNEPKRPKEVYFFAEPISFDVYVATWTQSEQYGEEEKQFWEAYKDALAEEQGRLWEEEE